MHLHRFLLGVSALAGIAPVLQPAAQSLFHRQGGAEAVPTGRVLVVSSGGGGDFGDIQSAVDAGREGDTVLLQSGLYGGFRVQGKSIAIVAEEGAVLEMAPDSLVRVEGLAPGQRVSVRGLSSQGAYAPRLEAAQNQGILWVEDSSFRSPWIDTLAAASFVDCGSVVLVGSSFVGGDAFQAEAHGLFAQTSELFLYDTTVEAGENFDTDASGTRGGDGFSGVELRSSSLFASGCTFTGGSSSSFHCPYGGGLMTPGDGGPALSLLDSDATTLDTILIGGTGYELQFIICVANTGPPLLQVSSTYSELSGSAHRLGVPSPLREGATAVLTLDGVPGESVFVHDTPVPAPISLPQFIGPVYSLAPTQILGLGALPGSGQLVSNVGIGALAPWLESTTVFSQGLFVDGSGGGENFAGSPTALTLLDGALQPVFLDCDANGTEDLLDVVLGGVPDCNRNGVPDACDIASGASGDCNRNGLPDECEAAAEELKLQPSNPLPVQYFGFHLEIDGDTLVVGVDTTDPADQAIYVFVRDVLGAWPATETQQLVSSVAGEDVFRSPALGGDTIVDATLGISGVLVWVRDPNTGVWPVTETTRLEVSNPSEDALQPYLATDGETIAVVALDDGVQSVFLYERNSDRTWPSTETAIVKPSESGPFLELALDDGTLVVGSTIRDAAYVFERDPSGLWPLNESVILKGDGSFSESYGGAVDVSGGLIVVGAQFNSELVWRSGAAYVYRKSGSQWLLETKLKALDPQLDSFGASVAVRGETIVVGASSRNTANGTSSGAAFLFQGAAGSWRQTAEFTGSVLSSFSRFGGELGLDSSGTSILVGARQDSTVPGLGSAFVFAVLDADLDGVPDECE